MFQAAATFKKALDLLDDHLDTDRSIHSKNKYQISRFFALPNSCRKEKKPTPIDGANPARHQGIEEIYDPQKRIFVHDFRPKTRKWRIEDNLKYNKYEFCKDRYTKNKNRGLYDRYFHAGKSDADYLKALVNIKYQESKKINNLVIDAYIEDYDYNPENYKVIIHIVFRHGIKYICQVKVSIRTTLLMPYFYDHLKAGVDFIMDRAWVEFKIQKDASNYCGINIFSTKDQAIKSIVTYRNNL